jgi:hypothetical protein
MVKTTSNKILTKIRKKSQVFARLKISGAVLAAVVAIVGLPLTMTASAAASTMPRTASTVAVPEVCGEISDNGGFGLEMRGDGVGGDVYMNSDGNCFTAIDKTYEVSYLAYAYEYQNGSGNCLYVSHDGTGDITLSSNCSASDQYELIVGFSVEDISGISGFSLDCVASSCTDNGADLGNQICAIGTGSGSDINIENNYDPNSNADRCTWTT